MKRNIKAWLLVLVLLLDDVVALVLVLLVLRLLGINMSLSLKIVIALIFGGFIFITHKAIIPALRQKKITGSEGMVGLKGQVIESLTPIGIIRVGDEYWKAKSVGGDIATGEEVEILGLDGLTLTVRLKDP